jgi:O-antigen/teichoic acid export membrane protein
MDATKRLSVKIIRHFTQDSLRRNSSLLILSQAINAGAAFIFWVVCAHLFKTREVGLAISMISFGTLISVFTNFGLPNTIIRFLPTSKNQGSLFTGALYSVIILSAIGGLLSWALIKSLVPKLGFIQSSIILSSILTLFIISSNVSSLLDGTFMAFRKGQYILGKALIINIPRIILPFFITMLGLRDIVGMVGVYVVMLIFGIIYSLYLIVKKLLKDESLRPTMHEVMEHRSFALGNYFGGMFGTLPGSLLPIVVLSRLGAVDAAYFYMPMQIALFLSIIPSSTGQALVSEASQNNNRAVYKAHFMNALTHLYRLLIPAILVSSTAGWLVLRLYGRAYVEHGYLLLVILSISVIFVAINWLGDVWLNIQQRAKAYFFMNAFNALAVVGFAYLLAGHGLLGIGIGWLIGQVTSAAVYLIIFARGQLFTSPSWLKIS